MKITNILGFFTLAIILSVFVAAAPPADPPNPGNWVFQEFSNFSSANPAMCPGGELEDGDWDTGCSIVPMGYWFGEYFNKSLGAASAVFVYKSNAGITYLPIPDLCFAADNVVISHFWGAMADEYYCNGVLFSDMNFHSTFYESGMFWNMSDPECAIDSDCPTCEVCSGIYCSTQTAGQDAKDECTEATSYQCVNDYTREVSSGFCSGTGPACNQGGLLLNVTPGKVCSGSGLDANPDLSTNCGTYSNCIINSTSAEEGYVGYAGDGTSNCQAVEAYFTLTGTNQTATPGYRWDVTGYLDTCTQVLYYVDPNTIPPPTPAPNYTAGGGVGGNYITAPDTSTRASTTVVAEKTGLTQNQRGAIFIGLIIFGLVAYNAGWLGVTRVRRRRK